MQGTLPELLEYAGREHADRTAVEDPQTGRSLSYSELAALAARVSRLLQSSGVARGDRVGICAPKSLSTVAAIHGILQAGAAYVPVDAGSPTERNAGIFRDCAAAGIFATPSVADSLRRAGLELEDDVTEIGDDLVFCALKHRAGRAGLSPGAIEPNNIAYILYTSGSTGAPKGVVHSHASARAFVDWAVETFRPTHDDRFSSHAPFHFDLSIFDLYACIAAGARVVLIGDEVAKQPTRLAKLIEDYELTIWYSTPSALRLLSGHGKLEQHDHSRLRAVLFAGEVFPISPLKTLTSQWPQARYYNLYGPTETNVCTYLALPETIPDDRMTPFSIGDVCAGDVARVVDSSDREMPDGSEGELLVSGPTVMREYWNLSDKTARAFVELDGRRWYRTGDIVRRTASDGFQFLGRRDRMVKRRGYRVELGEIEAALSLHPRISGCAVVAQPDSDTGVRIVAAIVQAGETKPSIVELKQFAAAKLPLYMVPDRFLFRESIPQTSTGKSDYQRLSSEL